VSDEKILADTLDALATLSEDTTGREFRTFRDAAKALRDAAAELDRLRALCARQRAWIDEVMAQEFWEDIVFEDSVIFRPAPFEDK
jgi:hypothetical protein